MNSLHKEELSPTPSSTMIRLPDARPFRFVFDISLWQPLLAFSESRVYNLAQLDDGVQHLNFFCFLGTHKLLLLLKEQIYSRLAPRAGRKSTLVSAPSPPLPAFLQKARL